MLDVRYLGASGTSLKNFSDVYKSSMSVVWQILGVLSAVANFLVHLVETGHQEIR